MNENGETKVSHKDLDNALIADGIEPEDNPTAEEITPEEDENKEIETEETDSTEDSDDDEIPPDDSDDEEEEFEVPDEPEDNRDRSKLGRRVSAIEESINGLITSQNAFLSRLEGSLLKEPDEEDDLLDESDDNEEDGYVSKKEVVQLLSRREKQKQTAAAKYNNDYNDQFRVFGQAANPDLHKEIMDELVANHNLRRSDNGARDAEINYLHAKADVLERHMATSEKPKPKENPLDKNKDKKGENLGGPSETQTPTKSEPVIKLDEHAADFVKRTGMSKETVKKVLEKETPGGLKDTRFSQA